MIKTERILFKAPDVHCQNLGFPSPGPLHRSFKESRSAELTQVNEVLHRDTWRHFCFQLAQLKWLTALRVQKKIGGKTTDFLQHWAVFKKCVRESDEWAERKAVKSHGVHLMKTHAYVQILHPAP